jgi:tetratricopeptide (TPR) repeat protein
MSINAASEAVAADVRVTGELIFPGDGSIAVSVTVNDVRERSRLLRVMDDVRSGDLHEFIGRSLSPAIAGVLERRHEKLTSGTPSVKHAVSAEAFECFAKAVYHRQKQTREGFERAVEWFQHAIDADPVYATAYAGLAHAFCSLATFQSIQAATAYVRARKAAERALLIDPDLAEAHAAVGRCMLYFEWDLHGADAAFKRALAIDPDCEQSRFSYLLGLIALGRCDDAITEARKAVEANPVHVDAKIRLGKTLYAGRCYGEAIRVLSQALEYEPDHPVTLTFLGCAQVEYGNQAAGRDLLQKAANDRQRDPAILAPLAHACTRCEDRHAAEQIFDQLVEMRKTTYVSSISLAWVCAALGRTDAAFYWIDKAIEERSPELLGMNAEPMFDSIRDDPRFVAMLARVGLPRVLSS